MHYQHRYHAGNFADVFKHVVLCALLGALNRKDTPWCYLETHAGAGLYDLRDEASERTGEWQDGIARLMDLREAPGPLADLLRAVRASQDQPDALEWYPGSPLIARALARPQDRLVLCEKVPEIAEQVRHLLRAEPRVAVHERDGYEAHGLLPPKEKRGLVLIDPPFEARDEFDQVREFLGKSLARFAGGIYAVWYPMKNKHEAQRFVRAVAREFTRPCLDIRFDNGAVREGQMRECGLLIVNPPFEIQRALEPALKLLARALAQSNAAHYTMEMAAVPGRKTP